MPTKTACMRTKTALYFYFKHVIMTLTTQKHILQNRMINESSFHPQSSHAIMPCIVIFTLHSSWYLIHIIIPQSIPLNFWVNGLSWIEPLWSWWFINRYVMKKITIFFFNFYTWTDIEIKIFFKKYSYFNSEKQGIIFFPFYSPFL